MKVAFLESAERDLRWFRRYYESVFPEGAARARAQYKRTLTLLKDNPRIGHPTDREGYRELSVARTPFLVVYRLANDRIEVIHIRDGRADS